MSEVAQVITNMKELIETQKLLINKLIGDNAIKTSLIEALQSEIKELTEVVDE